MNSACTVDLEMESLPPSLVRTLWRNSQETTHEPVIRLPIPREITKPLSSAVSTTSMSDPWSSEQLRRDAVVTVPTTTNKLLVRDLGWTREQALETRLRLRGFEEDWDAPGMEIYDEL